jgi:Ca-activated chloride channel family protein
VFPVANKLWLYALFSLPLVILFFVLVLRQTRKTMALFGNAALMEKLSASVNRTGRIWKVILLVIVLAFLILALARPKWGTQEGIINREGQDILIALDVSTSMLAEDIQPNRLKKAKSEINSLISYLEEQSKGDRVGLIAFSGKAFLQCPLTLDYPAVKMFLEDMGPERMPVQGTQIDLAIETAMSAFVEKEIQNKILILITDGEEHNGKAFELAKTAATQNIRIYTVGVGSGQGSPIPLFDSHGNQTGYKKDRSGEVVMTKLDELTLEKIALETKAKYYRALPGQFELGKIYEEIDKMEKKTTQSQQYSRMKDQFQWFIGIALVLLLIETSIPDRKKTRKEWKGRFK